MSTSKPKDLSQQRVPATSNSGQMYTTVGQMYMTDVTLKTSLIGAMRTPSRHVILLAWLLMGMSFYSASSNELPMQTLSSRVRPSRPMAQIATHLGSPQRHSPLRLRAGAAEEVVPRGAQNWRAGEQEGLTRQFGVGISLRVKS